MPPPWPHRSRATHPADDGNHQTRMAGRDNNGRSLGRITDNPIIFGKCRIVICVVRTTRKDQNHSVVPPSAESRGLCFHLALRHAIQIQIDEPCTPILTASNALQLCCSSSSSLSRSQALLVPMTSTRIGRPRTVFPAATIRIAGLRALAKWTGDCRSSTKVNGSMFLVMPFGPTTHLMVRLMFASSKVAFCALWVAWERSSTSFLPGDCKRQSNLLHWHRGPDGRHPMNRASDHVIPQLVVSSPNGCVCRSLADPRPVQELQRASILSSTNQRHEAQPRHHRGSSGSSDVPLPRRRNSAATPSKSPVEQSAALK